ncbi:hypothetical protein GJ744_004343 [Endocarpon pusillum]|uniref:Uncharacterized protein n=1 Tax=Endocarpon pusillum TaxID=364733 RepID=A0A8H7A9H4_9EURO|nr:hypothetical protein GJ744_004343 [Endocarpon pusillum]
MARGASPSISSWAFPIFQPFWPVPEGIATNWQSLFGCVRTFAETSVEDIVPAIILVTKKKSKVGDREAEMELMETIRAKAELMI